jgi:hypothetical protein
MNICSLLFIVLQSFIFLVFAKIYSMAMSFRMTSFAAAQRMTTAEQTAMPLLRSLTAQS